MKDRNFWVSLFLAAHKRLPSEAELVAFLRELQDKLNREIASW